MATPGGDCKAMGLGPRRRKPLPVKLFCGIIARPSAIVRALRRLSEVFGGIDVETPEISFETTTYYEEEMGKDLLRKWIAFEGLHGRGYLALAKHKALEMERELSIGDRRAVNIDPGYVDNAQVVLATTKNYAHRIYIGMGYYAEVALIFRKGSFQVLEWTYPDYRSDTALEFFHRARAIYHAEVGRIET